MYGSDIIGLADVVDVARFLTFPREVSALSIRLKNILVWLAVAVSMVLLWQATSSIVSSIKR
jgi:hypothetical protein